MAAPIGRHKFWLNLRNSCNILQKSYRYNGLNSKVTSRSVHTGSSTRQYGGIFSQYRRVISMTGGCVFGFTVAYTWVSKNKDVFAAQAQVEGSPSEALANSRPEPRISRVIKSATDNTGLKLTLYQYQTCPFCCKVRAFLDYYGFAYNVVEVNSVTRKQVKWSDYKKVPILVCEDMGKDGYLQLNDSSVIISLLESYLEDRNVPIETLLTYYPPLESKSKGRTVLEFPNKYYIMYGDKKPLKTTAEIKEERRWRNWVENELVHMLSPNVYQSPREALQAFNYFSEVGHWEQNFSTAERYTVIYVGATFMYFLGKYLKYKYCKKETPRESLYDSLDTWVRAVGKGNKFMGGNSPNLADLSVYGVLCSIEGCEAWQDALQNTRIKRWFNDTKAAVDSHAGAQLLATKGAWVKKS